MGAFPRKAPTPGDDGSSGVDPQEAKLIKPQHAIQRLYELTRGHDVYIATEVGRRQIDDAGKRLV